MRFLQSPGDFPMTVSLGKRVPARGLSRRGGGVPTGLLSLGDTAFEYPVFHDGTAAFYKRNGVLSFGVPLQGVCGGA
jgi:hypothetical protein